MSTVTSDIGTSLLYENEHVRVWEMTLEPGEACQVHKHAHDYVYAYVTPDNDLEVEFEGREPQPVKAGDGFVQYTVLGEADELPAHRLRNVGSRPHRQILVEFLEPTRAGSMWIDNNGRMPD